MEQPSYIDLTKFSFDAFVSFLFDRGAPPDSEHQDRWYYHVEVEFDPETICAYYVQLFRRPEFLLERFTKSQLDEGFWAIEGPNLNCSAYRLIHDSDLPLSAREECIRSMTDLFERLFSKESLDSSVQMWWDSLCYDWHCGNRNRDRGGEDERLQDVFFQTLSILLSSDSENCQGAALHGLGHLHHPETPQLIELYIQQHPMLTKERKEYAHSAARFEVL
jgi:hypothetical protein